MRQHDDAEKLCKGDKFRIELRVISCEHMMHEHGVEHYSLIHDPSGRIFRWRYTGAYTMDTGKTYTVNAQVSYINNQGVVAITRGRFHSKHETHPSVEPEPDGPVKMRITDNGN